MLEQAELKAREYAKQANIAIGQVPPQAKLHYQIAIQLREGKVEDRLRALEYDVAGARPALGWRDAPALLHKALTLRQQEAGAR